MEELSIEELEAKVEATKLDSEKQIAERLRIADLKAQLAIQTDPRILAAKAELAIVQKLDSIKSTMVAQGIKENYYSTYNKVLGDVVAICQMVKYAGRNTAFAEAASGVSSALANKVVDVMPQYPYYSPTYDNIVNEEFKELDIAGMAVTLPAIFAALEQDVKHIDPRIYDVSEHKRIYEAILKQAKGKMKQTHKANKKLKKEE